MRRFLPMALTVVVSLLAAGSADAVVVDMNALGHASAPYGSAGQNGYYGVALVPGTRGTLPAAGIPSVTSSPPCTDPALTLDLVLPSAGLCSHGGAVLHSNETFALTWDPHRKYWQTTRDYVEQFLSDVAKGSGTLSSPYAVTTQYTDATGRAGNASLYGGGCIDYGVKGGSACKFGTANGTGAGYDYPANGCPVTGTNEFSEDLSGAWGPAPNDICLTDAQLRGELTSMISQTQTDVLAHLGSGYAPLVVMLTPPGVEVCLDAAGTLCSANGGTAAQFCSYHAQVSVGGTEVAYVVQPWVAVPGKPTACVEPDAPTIPPNPAAQVLANDVGAQLVSPLSQGQIAAVVNPGLNAWFALDGAEINDNGCVPFGDKLDSATVGSGGYFLQREFNNGGLIEADPNALVCTPNVALAPTFVVPSAVNLGDVVEFDGSTTVSSLIVPNAGYVWSFGDGQTAVGPSVVHTYAKAGNFAVKLTVTDRGGNAASVSQTLAVAGPGGKPVPPPPTHTTVPAWHARLQLAPQSRRAMLRLGVALWVRSDRPADGFATISISRRAARHAHIRVGRAAAVVIGHGTFSGIKNGTVKMHLRLSRAMAAKLRHLGHVTLTVRLVLTAADGAHVAIDAAGRY